jgi:uncharacterized SAM-binding protein YcdF (DUF218 family)
MPSFSRLIDLSFLLLAAWAAGLVALRWKVTWPSRRARVAWWAMAATWALTWLACTPAVALALVGALEPPPVDLARIDDLARREQTALVVLNSSVGEPVGGDAPLERLDPEGTARAIGAARVWRRLQTPVVIVSGIASPGQAPDANTRAMADLLVMHGVPAERVLRESASRNTRENAIYSVRMARAMGLTRFVVVTSALHIPRSLREFRRAGVNAIGVSVHPLVRPSVGGGRWWPSSWSLGMTQAAVHEFLGMLKP